MEKLIDMPPELAFGLSVYGDRSPSGEAEVMENGLRFLRNKARQYGLNMIDANNDCGQKILCW